jgi:hypothetical protein
MRFFRFGQLSLLSSHYILCKIGVVRETTMCLTELILIETNDVEHLVKNLLCGLILLLQAIFDEFLVSLPILLLVSVTTLLVDVDATFFQLLASFCAHELKQLQEVIIFHTTVGTSQNIVETS